MLIKILNVIILDLLHYIKFIFMYIFYNILSIKKYFLLNRRKCTYLNFIQVFYYKSKIYRKNSIYILQ